MSTQPITVEQGLQTAGVGKFQYRLFLIFGLVWMAEHVQRICALLGDYR